MRLLKTLYIDQHDVSVTVRDRSVVVRRDGALVNRFPMAELEAVVLTGGAAVTTEALARCVREGVRVCSVSRGGSVRFTVGGPVRGNVLLRVEQLRAFDNRARANELCKMFVAGKLQNYRRLLQRWSWDAYDVTRKHLDRQREGIEGCVSRLRDAPDGDTIRGIEGDATRRYFKGLGAHLAQNAPAMRFTERTRRPPRDPVNALLGYLYGLLVGSIAGALDAVGLDPQVGYLHGLRPGRPSLALDLVEEFRPALADRFAVSLLTLGQLGPEHFQEAAGGAWYLTDDGRRALLARWEAFRSVEVTHPVLDRPVPRGSLPLVQATILARHLRGDIESYAPYVMER